MNKNTFTRQRSNIIILNFTGKNVFEFSQYFSVAKPHRVNTVYVRGTPCIRARTRKIYFGVVVILFSFLSVSVDRHYAIYDLILCIIIILAREQINYNIKAAAGESSREEDNFLHARTPGHNLIFRNKAATLNNNNNIF